ncbi:MAG TPA: GntR family transcriptional regulator [Chloroflexota bacterium]|nr:GntR family transcriptional regulator [Chloroflexota bacterium]
MTRADTLATQAYEAIRLALLHGQLRPDQFYSENSVALMLGISRTPAREALRQLETEGLIEVLPQRGFRVRRISAPELVEFYDLRGMLESYVVRTLSRRIDERQISSLRHILERQQLAAADVTEFIGLDEEFHLSMARMAGLQRTARIVASLRGVLWLMGTRIVDNPTRRTDVVGEHEAILAALERHDEQAASDAVTHHIRATAQVALARDGLADTLPDRAALQA